MTSLCRSSGTPPARGDCASTPRWVWPCVLALSVGPAAGCDWFGDVLSESGQSRSAVESAEPPERGFLCRTFPDETGNQRGYVVFVPHDRPREKPPVLMFLNGRGENGDNGISIGNNFGLQIWEMQEFFPFLGVAPQCGENGSWSACSPDVTWALQVLDSVIEEFGADKDRVYLTGVSSGGSGVWSVGSAYAERFAALVPLCGVGGADVQRLTSARMPIWIFYNDQDEANLVESNRRNRKELITLGLSPLVSEYHATGHDCWNRAYRTTAMYGWLLEQSRSKNAAEALFEYLPAERLVAEWRRKGAGEWTVGEDGSLIGQGGDGLGLLVSSAAAAGSIEIHGDLWLPADSVGRMAVFNGAASESGEGLRLSIMLPDVGTGGVARSGGESLAQLDPAAQRALQPDAWNDVRVRLAEGRLTVRLNGWPAVDVRVEPQAAPAAECRCALVTPDDGSEVRWRDIRSREW